MKQKILSKNDLEAQKLREIFKAKNIFVINLMSSPGSGKTTLLENLARFMDFCVIEGDLETNRDAKRLQNVGINAYQITTGDACHLEANMIALALQKLNLKENGFLFIENVGNLVCPASYDLAQNLNIVLLSTPEGDDKILKYPTMFLIADVVLISKSDVKDFFNFQIERVKEDLNKLNPRAKIFEISNKNMSSIEQFSHFLKSIKKEQ